MDTATPVTGLIPLPPQEFIDAVGGSDYHATGKHFFDLFTKQVGLSRNAAILDIGCGCGRLAVPLTTYIHPQAAYHGIDIVKPMVDWCTAEITSRYPNFTFHHADLTNTLYNAKGTEASGYRFPFSDETFDFIFLTSVFTHLNPEDMRNYLTEIHRVLKPKGQVFMTFYIMNGQYRKSRENGSVMVSFEHGRVPYWIHNPDVPEAVSAYDEAFVLWAIRETGLVVSAISYGGWNNNTGAGWTFQDVVIAAKPPR